MLVRVMVNSEPNTRWKRNQMGCQSIEEHTYLGQCSVANPPTGMVLGDEKKDQNPEEAHKNMPRNSHTDRKPTSDLNQGP